MLGRLAIITAILFSPVTLAAKYDGGVALRIGNESGTCINIEKHRISLHLRRFLLGKDASWFSADKEAGSCENVTYQEAINPYSLFILNAKPQKSSVSRTLIETESLQRCIHFGINKNECV